MCNLSYAIEEKGIEKGCELMGKLIHELNASGRYEDIDRASADKDYRDKLLKEFNII